MQIKWQIFNKRQFSQGWLLVFACRMREDSLFLRHLFIKRYVYEKESICYSTDIRIRMEILLEHQPRRRIILEIAIQNSVATTAIRPSGVGKVA